MYKLIRFIALVVFASILLIEISQAQQLSIKTNFWGTRKYSTDGIEYYNFGKGWGDFKSLFGEDDKSISMISQARTFEIIGIIFSIPGGYCLGYVAGREIRGRDYEPAYLTVGLTCTVGMIGFAIAADRNLKKAVKNYNSNLLISDLSAETNSSIGLMFKPGWIGIRYNF